MREAEARWREQNKLLYKTKQEISEIQAKIRIIKSEERRRQEMAAK